MKTREGVENTREPSLNMEVELNLKLMH
uniref:Uncharacterized protein n=1 Tax=Anguilla anguilla TaxID=7936 RepID=A0A0E9QZM0_ANGAN